jgi:lipopolysaccharide/colanic/teichoic acid biosynthesis glycosyltransferase
VTGSRYASSGRKRALDLLLACAAGVVAVPVLAVLALLVKVESRGPVIFRQERVGLNGRAFWIYKLRTMVEGADRIGAGLYAEANDPRFTRIGLFARRFSLDELPQVFNILRGDMSVVGPRPMLRMTVDEYADAYREILHAKPGVTGLAQVNGRNALSRSRRLAYDAQYARECSLSGDLRILWRTIAVVVRGDGQLNSQGREDVEV